jgi:hypothetical protein
MSIQQMSIMALAVSGLPECLERCEILLRRGKCREFHLDDWGEVVQAPPGTSFSSPAS